ncbi:homocysteine S-methyltransferase family protein [Flavonifractor hominis]|uniref:Methionine synthase n=1 Tax=Flavonifractor hominis TaxID=3133178 RepID=A0ABV1EVJ0_9FIRM
MKLREELGRRVLICDGAMGTMLQAAGLPAGREPELWNLEQPALIQQLHGRYLAAGADIITTNTFGANAVKLAGHPVEEIAAAGVRLARAAVEQAGHGYVALDVGPTGRLLQPAGDLSFEEAVAAYAPAIRAGAEAGADLVLIETMSDLYEAKAAVIAAKENCTLPIFVTVALDERGRLLTGGDIPAAVALLEGLGVDALGLNCGLGPQQMAALFPTLCQYASLPILLQPNAGLPECTDGCTHFHVTPEQFAGQMAQFARDGAWIVGGCCGTTPEHIRAMAEACRSLSPLPLQPKHRTWVSSYARTVDFAQGPVLIGERINPTGKPRLKQALRERDVDYVLREAVTQQQNGAQVLDVNAGLPDLDEAATLALLIPELQGVTDLPLQIDTADPAAMEQAMRLYNGRPLVNSVNGKHESMHSVFPLMRKYGGVAIALTLDEEGIPPTAEGRLAIARRIVDTAAAYGIPREDLVFDTLAMTISADPTAARTTLEALTLIREQLGCHTSLGVSNISFGLPQRETVNAAFFLLALEHGLSAAILNPNSKAMMQACLTYRALNGQDANCQAYIAAMAQASPDAHPAAPTEGPDLKQAVLRGLRESAVSAARADLDAGRAPMEIIDTALIPALDQVGAQFERGQLYLPQLLMSADAARAVFELLRERMTAQPGQLPASKGKVVLATVKGDVHDIGKNIVKVLLENYGYQVIDLGKDVSPEAVADAVVREGAGLCGLSALMTTTVGSMEQTIALLRQRAPQCRIMAGGAVLTADYAQRIGADFYGKDAMSDVRYAESLLP